MSFLRLEGVRQALVYFTGIILLFLLLLMADRFLAGLATRPHLAGFMAFAVLMGILNCWLLGRPLYNNVPDWLKAMLTLSANLVGAVFFMAISPNTLNPVYGELLLPALLLFSLPWFFAEAVKALLSIPALAYEPLQVPDLRDIVAEINWAENEERGIIWKFGVLREINQQEEYWVRTHTPHRVLDIPLKELFKGLLSLHNHNLSPTLPIYFKEKRPLRRLSNEVIAGQVNSEATGAIEVPFGWRFYSQKKFLFWNWETPLDPEKTLRQNGVRFRPLTDEERAEITNLRKGLSPKFKTTAIIIKRV